MSGVHVFFYVVTVAYTCTCPFLLHACVGFEGYDLPDDRYEEWLESREHCKVDVSDTVNPQRCLVRI